MGPAPVAAVLEPGTSQTIGVVPTVQRGPSGAIQWVFRDWSDGGAPTHDITVPDGGGEFMVNFDTQFFLSTSVVPFGAGEVFVSPQTMDGYYNVGTDVILAASTDDEFNFAGWLEDGTSASLNPTRRITVDEQRDSIAVYAEAIKLVSGERASFTLPPFPFPALHTDPDLVFSIEVPPGATELKVEVAANNPGQDVDLFVRRVFPPEVSDGQVVADHSSTTFGAFETVIVTPTSTPPLEPVTYFIALASFTVDATINGSVTATIKGGDPQPEVGLSAEALTFTSPDGTNPAPQTLSIRNVGADTLSFLVNSDQPWLHATPNEGTSMGDESEITIHTDSSSLPPGTYDGNLSILQVDELPEAAEDPKGKAAPMGGSGDAGRRCVRAFDQRRRGGQCRERRSDRRTRRHRQYLRLEPGGGHGVSGRGTLAHGVGRCACHSQRNRRADLFRVGDADQLPDSVRGPLARGADGCCNS